jgi:hypothetical protein
VASARTGKKSTAGHSEHSASFFKLAIPAPAAEENVS